MHHVHDRIVHFQADFPVEFKEIIIAINPTTEGEATTLYLERTLQPLNKKITRLGPPASGEILLLLTARAIPGSSDVPRVAPTPDASICNDFLRLIIR